MLELMKMKSVLGVFVCLSLVLRFGIWQGLFYRTSLQRQSTCQALLLQVIQLPTKDAGQLRAQQIGLQQFGLILNKDLEHQGGHKNITYHKVR